MTPAQYRKQPRPAERRFHEPVNREEAFILLQPYLNADLAVRNDYERGFSTQHLFIPLKAQSQGTRDFHKTFPLQLLVDTPEELLQLPYYKEELLKCTPAALILKDTALSDGKGTAQALYDLKRSGINVVPEENKASASLRTCHAETVAEAFDDVLKKPDLPLRLFGNGCSLFTKDGLPSPYFSLYSALASIDGCITEKQSQYLLISGKASAALLVYQIGGSFDLNVHLQFKTLHMPAFMLKKSFDAGRSISEVAKMLGIKSDMDHQSFVDHQVYSHILQHLSGETNFISTAELTNRRFDFIIRPNELVLLIIK